MLGKSIALVILALFAGLPPHNDPPNPYAVFKNSVVEVRVDSSRRCTMFYVGDNKFVTAYHCTGNGPYQFHSGKLKLSRTSTSPELDVTVLTAAPPIEMTPLKVCDKPEPLNAELIGVGYPAYLQFLTGSGFDGLDIEIGHAKGYSRFQNVDVLVSTDLSYAGMSGGPVMDVETGCVAGMHHYQTAAAENDNHTVSLIVPAASIKAALKVGEEK